MNSLLTSLCLAVVVSTAVAQFGGGFGQNFGQNFGGNEFGVFAGNRFGDRLNFKTDELAQADVGVQSANQDQTAIGAGSNNGVQQNAGLGVNSGSRLANQKAAEFAEVGNVESFNNDDVKAFDKGSKSIAFQLVDESARSNGVAVSHNDGNQVGVKTKANVAENLAADDFNNVNFFNNAAVFDKGFLNAGVFGSNSLNAFNNQNQAAQSQLAAENFADTQAKKEDNVFGNGQTGFGGGFGGGIFGGFRK